MRLKQDRSEFYKKVKKYKYDEERGCILLDPNDWGDVLWWYEDEEEIYEFMINNEKRIKEYAEKNNLKIRDAVYDLFKRENEQ